MRSKALSRTVPQNLRLFLWMLDYVWMGYLLLIFGTWRLKFYVQPTTMSNPTINGIRETGANLHSKSKAQNVRKTQKVDQLSDADYVPTNTHSSQGESQLYIFEVNEAVIKMIIKGRSSTGRSMAFSIYFGKWTNSERKRERQSSTSSLFHTSGSVRKQFR